MILKTKTLQMTKTPQTIAGQKQEQDVAFFLRRAFKDHPEVLVINDFKFSFNDETAQIDHLLVYTYGFVLIESKSIKGHVKVNNQGEWTRSYNSHWSGMPSPIKQVELQQALLKEMLMHHRNDILSKLLGIKQQGFNGRCWHYLCAVSSNAVIDRKTMPKDVSEKLFKTEFLVDELKRIMKLKHKLIRLVNVTDTRPDFNQQELDSIGQFLISQHIDSNIQQVNNTQVERKQTQAIANTPELEPELQPALAPTHHLAQSNATILAPVATLAPDQHPILSCKYCGESTQYTPMYGKFGYYINCNQCSKNTSMKLPCPQCMSKNTKVTKRKETYTLNCVDCEFEKQII
ncbi:nuclease-related domain-containing protein [Shewanella livingstonensis]|uniref:NERD domain-containing protein n=1 Tax=Shewanella livingstonensis TaxID=150120 RepID=A0A3G8LYW6_9GAMM|nr:nuclease-related domain-containing protein [Shewanella livingstonensis]AZG74889.1 NERD domain-containing protein [Shewanella livingstonensis]